VKKTKLNLTSLNLFPREKKKSNLTSLTLFPREKKKLNARLKLKIKKTLFPRVISNLPTLNRSKSNQSRTRRMTKIFVAARPQF
jgi:hypothetical protein